MFTEYTLTKSNADAINKRRKDFKDSLAGQDNTGFVGHIGNPVYEGEVFPAVVVKNFGHGNANLQVFLDGNDVFWATSVHFEEK